jgi:hypothetical protein
MFKVEGMETIYKGKKNGTKYIIGTVGELRKIHVLAYADYPDNLWCILPMGRGGWFADTLEELIEWKDENL